MIREKTNKGITLIALVITIIVLLILVGVSINMLTGDNGLLGKTKETKVQSEMAEAKERAKLDIEAWKADRLSKKQDINLNDSIVKKILEDEGANYAKELGETTFKTVKSGYEIAYADLYDKGSNIPVVPSGGTTITEEVKVAGTVFEENTKMKDVNNKEVMIPANFKLASDSALTVAEGIVIDDGEGNQFVWIPVESEAQYKRTNFNVDGIKWFSDIKDDTGYLPTGVEILEGKTEGEVEKQKVVNAGGFYIGRYEAGKDKEGNLVCKKDEDVWVRILQSQAKEESKKLKPGKTALITGIQWDRTMDFIKENVETSEYDVTKVDSDRHTGSPAKTGANPKDKVCNIYDLEGSCYEYIAEKRESNYSPCVSRGGHYSNYSSASYRNSLKDSVDSRQNLSYCTLYRELNSGKTKV